MPELLDRLITDIEDCRWDKFDLFIPNGDWPETWDSSVGREYLAKYLIEQGWSKNA